MNLALIVHSSCVVVAVVAMLSWWRSARAPFEACAYGYSPRFTFASNKDTRRISSSLFTSPNTGYRRFRSHYPFSLAPSSSFHSQLSCSHESADLPNCDHITAADEANLISSTKSNTVKRIQALLTKKKKRLEWRETVVEGPRMVLDLLRNPKTRPLVRQVVVSIEKPEWRKQLLSIQQNQQSDLSLPVSEGRDPSLDGTQSVSSFFRICDGTPEVLQACSDTATPQGIVAVVQIPDPPSEPPPAPALLSSAQDNFLPYDAPMNQRSGSEDMEEPNVSKNFLYLVLDGVSDPGNVGTLLRSSVAVGVAAVVILPECCDVWSPKAIRSSMGSSFLVPIIQLDSLRGAIDHLKTNRKVLHWYAATMEERGEGEPTKSWRDNERHSLANVSSTLGNPDETTEDNAQGECFHHTIKPTNGGSIPYDQITWVESLNIPRRSAIIIGNEGSGLSGDARKAICDGQIQPIHVPMEPGIESLNAAVCGSIILFEYSRQCRISQAKKAQK